MTDEFDGGVNGDTNDCDNESALFLKTAWFVVDVFIVFVDMMELVGECLAEPFFGDPDVDDDNDTDLLNLMSSGWSDRLSEIDVAVELNENFADSVDDVCRGFKFGLFSGEDDVSEFSDDELLLFPNDDKLLLDRDNFRIPFLSDFNLSSPVDGFSELLVWELLVSKKHWLIKLGESNS